MNVARIAIVTAAALVIAAAGSQKVHAGVTPLDTAFTYQGVLNSGGAPADGTFHLRFQLWNALVGGAQVGVDVDAPAVAVSEGLFTLPLDFGSDVFDGSARWLQVQVITGGGTVVTSLAPRQPITAAPYALQTRGIFVNDAGKVGIGHPAPPALLSVQSTTANPSNNTAQFGAPSIGPWDSHIHFGDEGDWYIRSAATEGKVILQDTGGNVGIGTSTPNYRLHVVSTGGATAIAGQTDDGTAVLGLTTDFVGVYGFATGDSAANYGVVGETVSPNGYAGYFLGRGYFDGNVGLGTLTPNVRLDVNGSIEYTGTITDVSDERLKENFAPLDDALAKVQRLSGVYFNMKDTPEQRDVGLLAQQVQQVLPEAVRVVDPESGHLGVSYPSLTPLLVEAVKALGAEKDSEIAVLKADIEVLCAENAELRERLDALEAIVLSSQSR